MIFRPLLLFVAVLSGCATQVEKVPALTGDCYDKGMHLYEIDSDEAFSTFKSGAGENPKCAVLVARLLQRGRSGAIRDTEEASKIAKEAWPKIQALAEEGHPVAYFLQGLMYRNGLGVKRDYDKAVASYKTAIDGGDKHSEVELGHMYLRGEGVEKNIEESNRLVLSAAEYGLVIAQRIIAERYESGSRLTRNPSEAEKWFRRAAANGDRKSRFILRTRYDPPVRDLTKETVLDLLALHTEMLNSGYKKVRDLYTDEAKPEISVEQIYASGATRTKDLALTRRGLGLFVAEHIYRNGRRKFHLEGVKVAIHGDQAIITAKQSLSAPCFAYPSFRAEVVRTEVGLRFASMKMGYADMANCASPPITPITEQDAMGVFWKRADLQDARVAQRAALFADLYAEGTLYRSMVPLQGKPGEFREVIRSAKIFKRLKSEQPQLLRHVQKKPTQELFSDIKVEPLDGMIKISAIRRLPKTCFVDKDFYLIIKGYPDGPKIVEERVQVPVSWGRKKNDCQDT